MPIRRHPALAPLSRDHHLALQLAAAVRAHGSTHLRARLPRDVRTLAEYVRGVFRDEITALLNRFGERLEAHVRAEERTPFARAQQLLDAGTLDRMAPRLTRHMVVHDTLAR